MKSLKNKYSMKRLSKFLKALWKRYVWGQDVGDVKYMQRLSVCYPCDDRDGGYCDICGCLLKLKAKWSTENCPEKKW
tara:strand:- start:822 stop:1052 length:231 start_codon:yes stop_codon:yes gene_type:complete